MVTKAQLVREQFGWVYEALDPAHKTIADDWLEDQELAEMAGEKDPYKEAMDIVQDLSKRVEKLERAAEQKPNPIADAIARSSTGGMG